MSGRNTQRRRRPVHSPKTPSDAETRIRAALAATPGASVKQIAAAAGVSSATASKYRRVVHAEQSATTAGQQGQHQQLAQ